MSEQDKEQRTEDPTGKRLQKAREEGRVARSTDLAFAIVLLVAGFLLEVVGDRLVDGFQHLLTLALSEIESSASLPTVGLQSEMFESVFSAITPLLIALFVLALAFGFAQSGLHFLPQKLDFKPEKLEPKLAISTFVNVKSLAETATSLLKLVVLVVTAWTALKDPVLQLMGTSDVRTISSDGLDLMVGLLQRLGGALFVIGFLDWMWKKQQHVKDLRMTKDEVKQENKDAMGDQEAKARIRSRQKQFAMQRMMEQVPNATAVIVNPTHFAVALRYEPNMAAPLVVAKGRDHIALKIKSIAREAGVPIVENPPLARALHDSARIGDEIPPLLYQAVAEVLAVILRTNRRVERRTA